MASARHSSPQQAGADCVQSAASWLFPVRRLRAAGPGLLAQFVDGVGSSHVSRTPADWSPLPVLETVGVDSPVLLGVPAGSARALWLEIAGPGPLPQLVGGVGKAWRLKIDDLGPLSHP
jgi:hypothetical protein